MSLCRIIHLFEYNLLGIDTYLSIALKLYICVNVLKYICVMNAVLV